MTSPAFANIPASWVLRSEVGGIWIDFPSRDTKPHPPYEIFLSYDGHIQCTCPAPGGKCWHVGYLRGMIHKPAKKPEHGPQDTSLSALKNIDKARKEQNCARMLDLYMNGNYCDAEIESRLDLPPNIVTARRNDLVRLGLVESKAYTVSPKSGLSVLSWGISDFAQWDVGAVR